MQTKLFIEGVIIWYFFSGSKLPIVWFNV